MQLIFGNKPQNGTRGRSAPITSMGESHPRNHRIWAALIGRAPLCRDLTTNSNVVAFFSSKVDGIGVDVLYGRRSAHQEAIHPAPRNGETTVKTNLSSQESLYLGVCGQVTVQAGGCLGQ